jgi:D-arabinose 1-dehydrogenase-like Zn-dependent alcohol dehydrogenase
MRRAGDVAIELIMKAYHYSGAGQLSLVDSPEPQPGDHDVVVQAAYCGIAHNDPAFCSTQTELALQNPLVAGSELAGTIAAAGKRVSNVKVGDRVLVRSYVPCGRCGVCEGGQAYLCQAKRLPGKNSPGFLQERSLVPASCLSLVPDELPLRQSVLCHDLATSMHAVKLAGIKPGDYALILGASLAGFLTAVAAEMVGAHVVMYDSDSDRLEYARSLGIDVIYSSVSSLENKVLSQTRHVGADRVFYCSHIDDSLDLPALVRCRGRIVPLASSTIPASCLGAGLSAREIHILGSATYTDDDLQAAIQAGASGKLPLQKLIGDMIPFDTLLDAAVMLPEGAPRKILISLKGS